MGCLTFVEHKLSWLDDFEHFVFQVLPDGGRKAIRKATDEDIKIFRVRSGCKARKFRSAVVERWFLSSRLTTMSSAQKGRQMRRCGGTMRRVSTFLLALRALNARRSDSSFKCEVTVQSLTIFAKNHGFLTDGRRFCADKRRLSVNKR